MKAPVILALTLSAAPFAVAGVDIGDTAEEVRAELGRPTGQMRVGARHVMVFERGSVELTDDRVTRVDLRTADQQAMLDAREERIRSERAARRAALVSEGTALRDRKLADAAFQAAPVAYQVSFWEDFSRRYPDVSCAEALSIARLKLADQIEEKVRKADDARRIADLEARLAAAESDREVYRVRSYFPRYGYYHRQQEFALWPVKYTYYDAPLPVVSTPTVPAINPLTRDPAQPERREYLRPGQDRGQKEGWRDRRDNRDGRGGERGRGDRRWDRA